MTDMADPIASSYLRGDLAAPERTLMDVLRATAAEHPEAAALDDGDVEIRRASGREKV